MSTLLSFWVISLLFVITPGMDWAYAIDAGARKRVLPAISGLLSGHFLVVIVLAFGIGSLIATQPKILYILILTGSLYLLYTGIMMIFRPAGITESGKVQNKSFNWYFKGFGVSGLNPKVYLLLLALLPQFIDKESVFPESMQILFLGITHLINCTIVYFLVGFGSFRILNSRPEATRIVSRISGLTMIVIVVLLLVEQLHHIN